MLASGAELRPKKFAELKKGSTFCVYPFIHTNLNTDGHPQVCCNSLKFQNEDNDTRPGDVLGFWQSPSMDELRKSLLNGERHPECDVCWREEDFCGNSLRKWAIEDTEDGKAWTKEDVEQRVFAFEQQQFQETMPSYVQFDFGNKCNLKCRMCNPMSSSSLAQEAYAHRDREELPDNLRKSSQELVSIDPWWDGEEFNQQLESFHRSLKSIRFTGGEPFLSAKFYDVLEKLIHSGQAKDCVLSLNTNGTIVTQRAIELMKSFKEVNLFLSVDGYGELLSYIRYPAKWQKVSENILKLNAISEFNVSVFVTVQVLNVVYLDQLVRWCYENRVRCSVSHLTDPAYYDISILPDALKDLATQRLQTVGAEVGEFMMGALDDVISHLRTDSQEKQPQWQRFIKNTRLTDEIREQNLLEVCPEFAPFVESSPQN